MSFSIPLLVCLLIINEWAIGQPETQWRVDSHMNLSECIEGEYLELLVHVSRVDTLTEMVKFDDPEIKLWRDDSLVFTYKTDRVNIECGNDNRGYHPEFHPSDTTFIFDLSQWFPRNLHHWWVPEGNYHGLATFKNASDEFEVRVRSVPDSLMRFWVSHRYFLSGLESYLNGRKLIENSDSLTAISHRYLELPVGAPWREVGLYLLLDAWRIEARNHTSDQVSLINELIDGYMEEPTARLSDIKYSVDRFKSTYRP